MGVGIVPPTGLHNAKKFLPLRHFFSATTSFSLHPSSSFPLHLAQLFYPSQLSLPYSFSDSLPRESL